MNKQQEKRFVFWLVINRISPEAIATEFSHHLPWNCWRMNYDLTASLGLLRHAAVTESRTSPIAPTAFPVQLVKLRSDVTGNLLEFHHPDTISVILQTLDEYRRGKAEGLNDIL